MYYRCIYHILYHICTISFIYYYNNILKISTGFYNLALSPHIEVDFTSCFLAWVPDGLFALVEECTQDDETRRPSFTHLANRILEVHERELLREVGFHFYL